jgi:hypothetical protein
VSDLDNFLSIPKHNTANTACSRALEHNKLHQNRFGDEKFQKYVKTSIEISMKTALFWNKKEILGDMLR